jgi:DNA end-binding protein Ku
MPARPSWKGFLKLSLVTVPLKAYSATASESEIRLNQLHAECHSRINYKKTCPLHGEIPNDQIVSGYEYSKGLYVLVDPDELDKLRTEDEKAINIDAFIPQDAVDPVYFSGKSHYLLPDGPVGQKPYSLLIQGMTALKRDAIARVVMHGRDQLVLIRPEDGLLQMTGLNYEARVTKPDAFSADVPKLNVDGEELTLTKALIEASSPKKLDMAQYKDQYAAKLTELVQKKVAGQEVVAPPVHEHAAVVNLMDALRASLAQAQKAQPEEAAEPRKMAPSVRKPARAGKRCEAARCPGEGGTTGALSRARQRWEWCDRVPLAGVLRLLMRSRAAFIAGPASLSYAA